MTELPLSWITTTLGEITTDCSQKIPADSEAFEYIDISSVDRQTKSIVSPQSLTGATAPSRARKQVQTGDVLVSMTRPNLNAVALVPDRLDGQIASTGFDVLRANEVEPRWIFNAVRSMDFVNAMSELVQGALYPAVRSKDVRGYALPLAPLNEQRRIADKLDATLARVDACRARLDRVGAILKRFRQAVLAAAVSGKLTEEWREENGVTEEWKTVPLASAARDFSYGSSSKSAQSGDVPVLRMGNIQNLRLDWTDLVYTSDPAEIKKYSLANGDVLFNRTNSPELVGKTAVYKGERPAIYAGYLIRIRCTASLLPDYLNFCINGPEGRAYCWEVKSDGVSQSNINAKKIAAFTLPLPSVEEQIEIVRRVETLFAFASHLETSLATGNKRLADLTPALLAKAFRGELVPQDPSDEPAEALLERIRAARAAAPDKPKRQGRGRPKQDPKSKVNMLQRNEISENHLAKILSERGALTAEALWAASKLEIDDFYDQLKDEESAGLLVERRSDDPKAPRLLERQT